MYQRGWGLNPNSDSKKKKKATKQQQQQKSHLASLLLLAVILGTDIFSKINYQLICFALFYLWMAVLLHKFCTHRHVYKCTLALA